MLHHQVKIRNTMSFLVNYMIKLKGSIYKLYLNFVFSNERSSGYNTTMRLRQGMPGGNKVLIQM